jgi:hypothetical protein
MKRTAQHLRLVHADERRGQPTIPRRAEHVLTATDVRFLRGLSRWPLPLLPAQRAWLAWLAGRIDGTAP